MSSFMPTARRALACVATALAAIMATMPAATWPTPALARSCAPQPGRVVQCVKPSETDPGIVQFNAMHYILFNMNPAPEADLLVFLTGTGGAPPGPMRFLKAAADAGYRVISLAYNDTPAINVYCPKDPDPDCTEKFRRMRIYGDQRMNDRTIDNPPAESIVNRLVKLLTYLDNRDPKHEWKAYFKGNTPNWNRIGFAGQSQGAGMAAFIAKQQLVKRVILFSSPWDFVISRGRARLAAWLYKPSRTPRERWFGGYHEKERTAHLIESAYMALRIPPDHVRVFALNRDAHGINLTNNPFHVEGISNPVYDEQRAYFLGHSP